MPIRTLSDEPGIRRVVIDHPPVNALPVAGWFELADALLQAGRDPETRVAVLSAEGKGFCAGVDIKEIQAKGDEALVGVNRGCAAAFAAVYDCEVPVVCAVQGFCLGGGIGLAGNADIVVASEDATFGLPEVDRGALGAATHLARLVPQHRMRQMVYTAQPAAAAELAAYGTVARVVPHDQLVEAALEIARDIATKSPTILRRAKESLNGIDPVDVKRSYRYEQGFTYELHVRGVADEQRAAFVEKRDADTFALRRPGSMDKRTTIDEIVGELRPGSTLGIGGWGSRRKPMAVVRAICRSDLHDLTVVSYGGPDVGLLCATGKASRVVCPFVTLDSIPLDPHWRRARQRGTVQLRELDEGMFFLGLQASAWRVPFLPTRAGLGSDVLRFDPDLRTVRSPYVDGPYADPEDPDDGAAELVAAPALRLDVAVVHANAADHHGNASLTGPDPFFDDLFLGAAKRRFVSAERLAEPGALSEGGLPAIHRLLTDGVAEAPRGAHFTACPPEYGRDERMQKEYAAAAKDDDAWAAFARRYVDVDEAEYLDAADAASEAPA